MVRLELHLERLLAHRRRVGEPHAVGGKDARERMDEHARHAERVGNQAGVLSGRAAEAAQRVLGHVVAALHRDLLDRFGHVADRDLHEALRDLLGSAGVARGAADLVGKSREFFARDCIVERLVALGPEHRGKEFRLDFPEHEVAVGDRERAAAAVARRARIGARRVRADAVARAVEMQDRAAACGDGVNAHHGRAHAHARHLGLERALEIAQAAAGEVRHVGRGAAHVEADDLVEASGERGARGADHSAGGTRQDAVLAGEAARVGQAPVRLHEHEAHAAELLCNPVHVPSQDGRQVGVHHRGVPARHELHQRAHLVRHGNLRVADGARQLRDFLLVLPVAVAVHEHDRDGAIALAIGRFEVAADLPGLERNQHLPSSADALLHLDNFRIEELGQDDVPVEDARPVLVGDAQRVAKTARDEEHGALALALEERIGRHGGAHLHDLDLFAGDGCAGGDCEQLAYPGDRGIAVAAGILGEQLVGEDAPVRAQGDDIGESAAAVDPELPFFHVESIAQAGCAFGPRSPAHRLQSPEIPDDAYRTR